MAYKKQTWVDDETVGTADRFNHMEAGIEDAAKTGGVEVGTIVYIEDDAPVPEGYVEVKSGYSTSEVKTGDYWIDGKPIYRKVVEIETLPNNTIINKHLNLANVETVVDFYGVASNGAENLKLPNTYPGAAQTYIDSLTVQMSGNTITTINVITNSDRSSYSAYAILEYTKTTD